MRTLKFKAWHTKLMIMSKPFYLSELEGYEGEVNAIVLNDKSHPITNTQFTIVENGKLCEDILLLQYVGTKDSNKNEIYEGDVFNCIYHRDGHTDHRYKVIFAEISSGFVLQRIGKPCPQTQVFQRISDVGRYEMLGNIYQNPELLNVQKIRRRKRRT